MAPGGARRQYRPPRPDSNTFETQEAFLDSLNPVPIDSVAEYNRRCPHCWKIYGDSDPDQENAEAPVKLRCSHVFGEKCLKELFGAPESVQINLVPMSFKPGSKGADLGRRLSAYVDQCGVDKGSLLIGGRREKDFARLLTQSAGSSGRSQLLGSEWTVLLMQAMNTPSNVTDVHILENALVFDIVVQAIKKAPVSAPYGSPLIPMSFGTSSMMSSHFAQLIGSEDTMGSLNPGQHLYNATAHVLSETGTSLSESASASVDNSGDDDETMLAFEDPSTSEPPSTENASASPVKSLSEPPEPKIQGNEPLVSLLSDPIVSLQNPFAATSVEEVEPVAPAHVEPGENAYASFDAKVSNKFHALDSEANILVTDSDIKSDPEKLEQKIKETAEALKDPSLAPYLPVYYDDAIDSSENPVTSAVSNSWKAVMTQETSIDKLLLLMKLRKMALKALEMDKKAQAVAKAQVLAQAQQEKHMIMMQKRHIQMHQERETKRKENMTDALSRALAKVYNDYEHFQYSAALAAGQPPPVKKMKLASSQADCFLQNPLPLAFTASVQNSINISTTIHRGDIGAKQYEVTQPYIQQASGLGDFDDEDDDGDDGDGAATVEKDEDDLSTKTVFLTRTFCGHCFNDTPDGSRAGCTIPESITWKDNKHVPDGCPVCRKVLFKKESASGRPSKDKCMAGK